MDVPTVVLIGGDGPLATMLLFLLEGDGYQVVAIPTSNTAAALQHARAADLLVVTATIKADCATIIAALHQASCYVPILVLSRGMEPAVRRHVFALGVVMSSACPSRPVTYVRVCWPHWASTRRANRSTARRRYAPVG